MYNADEEKKSSGRYFQRFDGLTVRTGDGPVDFAMDAPRERSCHGNFVEDRTIAAIDRKRADERKRPRCEATMPRVLVMDEAAERSEARAQVEKAWREQFVARGIIRRRAA